jgi:hypothetical protein
MTYSLEIASISSQRVTGGDEFCDREFCGGLCGEFFKRDLLLGSGWLFYDGRESRCVNLVLLQLIEWRCNGREECEPYKSMAFQVALLSNGNSSHDLGRGDAIRPLFG